MDLFSRKNKGALALVLDVGSGSVGGGMVLLSSGAPSLLYVTRRELPHSESGDAGRMLGNMLQTLSQTLTLLFREGFPSLGYSAHQPIREVFVFLSAPWAISRTDFLHLAGQQSVVITEDLFRELLRNQQKDGEAGPLVPIEQKLIKAELNGYETPSPYRLQARRALFAVFSSFSSDDVIRKIESAIERFAHPSRISFHSFSLGAAAALMELYPAVEDFILLDISGEQTEVAIVKGGVLLQNITFPFGRNHFLCRLKTATSAPSGAIATFLKLWGEGKGTGAGFESLQASANNAAGEWLRHLEQAIRSFSEELFLPQTVFVTADEDIRPAIEAALRGIDTRALSPGARPFNPIHVTENALASSLARNPAVPADPFLVLETLFGNKLRFGESAR